MLESIHLYKVTKRISALIVFWCSSIHPAIKRISAFSRRINSLLVRKYILVVNL
jgi:hypothetical protein